MLYDQSYVNIFHNRYFEGTNKKWDSILTDSSFSYDITNLKDREVQRCLEHYLLSKKEKHEPLTEREKLLAQQMFTSFRQHPELFYNSPIIKNASIDLFAQDKQTADRIKNFRDRFFDMSNMNELVTRYINNTLDDTNINRLFSMLTVKLHKDTDYEKSKNKEIYEALINKLYNKYTYIADMKETEFAFLGQYITNYTNRNRGFFVDFNTYSGPPLNGGYSSKYHIWLNKTSNYMLTLTQFTKTVCHENRHSYQHHSSLSEHNRPALDMVMRGIISENTTTSSYDPYSINYQFQDIEIDAEEHGYWDAGVFLRMSGRADLADQLRDQRVVKLDKRTNFEFMKDSNGVNLPPDAYLVNNMDTIIAKKPEYLKMYDVLNDFYNPDGSKKSFEEIYNIKMTENLSNRNLSDSYVVCGIMRGDLDKLNLDSKSLEYRQNAYKTLASVYRDHAITFKDYCKESADGIDKDRVIGTTRWKLSTMNKILDYVSRNMDKILACREEKLSNNSFIYNFIYDLRDFDLSSITNDKIKNDPTIQQMYSEIKTRLDYIVLKFNDTHVKDRTSMLSQEEMNSMITLPNGRQLPFNSFCSQLAQKMDSHQNVIINGNTVYAGDLISYYKKIIKENKMIQYNNQDAGLRVG